MTFKPVGVDENNKFPPRVEQRLVDAIFSKATSDFTPARDLPSVIAHYDFSSIPGSVGDSVSFVQDLSGNGNHITQTTTAYKPTIAAASGRRFIALGASGFLSRATAGVSDWLSPTVGYSQPITFIAVCRAASASSGSRRDIVGAVSPDCTLVLDGSTNILAIKAGATQLGGGPSLNDAQWHVNIGVLAGPGADARVDGYTVASVAANTYGTNALSGIAVGGNGSSTAFNGDMAEVIICNGRLNAEQIAVVVKKLGAKHGVSVAPVKELPAAWQSTVSPNGQSVRIWEPFDLKPGAPLLMYCHNYTGTEALSPAAGAWVYPLIQAAAAEGWRVCASRQHSDNWGNQSAIDDNYDLYSMMNARQAVNQMAAVASSMGGLSAALMAADSRFPIKGIATQDAVFDLADVYTPGGSFQNYAASIKTAYGIAADGSDYISKTSGHNPMLRSASDYTNIRWRFYKSLADVNVSGANNTDAFATKVAAAVEKGVVTNPGTHISSAIANPADFMAFLRRCVS